MDFRRIKKAAEQQGWRTERLKSGHWRFVPPDPSRAMVVTGGTPSDRRALRNFLAQLKRSGLVWPWPPRTER